MIRLSLPGPLLVAVERQSYSQLLRTLIWSPFWVIGSWCKPIAQQYEVEKCWKFPPPSSKNIDSNLSRVITYMPSHPVFNCFRWVCSYVSCHALHFVFWSHKSYFIQRFCFLGWYEARIRTLVRLALQTGSGSFSWTSWNLMCVCHSLSANKESN